MLLRNTHVPCPVGAAPLQGTLVTSHAKCHQLLMCLVTMDSDFYPKAQFLPTVACACPGTRPVPLGPSLLKQDQHKTRWVWV